MTKRERFFEAGVQYGHKLSGWNPRMKPFIWGKKDSIHIINLAITEMQVAKAEELLESIAAKGKPILWVGTKKVAKNIIKKCAQDTTSPFFADHWVGGTLTNHNEVKKAVTNMLYDIEILEKSDRAIYTKKELNTLKKRIDRAQKNVGGIEKLAWPIGALIVADVMRDCVAVREAIEMKIPVIALVDTNCDPNGIDIVIPANDDLESSVEVILQCLAEAVIRGKERFVTENPNVVAADVAKKEDANKKSHGQNRFQKNDNNARFNGEKRFNNNNRSENQSENRSEGRRENNNFRQNRPAENAESKSATDNKRFHGASRGAAAPVQELKRAPKEQPVAAESVKKEEVKAAAAPKAVEKKAEEKKVSEVAVKKTVAKEKAPVAKKTTAAESKTTKTVAKKKA